MNETPVILSVSSNVRPSERALRVIMGILTGLFLLYGIFLSTVFMLPCFCMAAAFYVYDLASKRKYEYEYTELSGCLFLDTLKPI